VNPLPRMPEPEVMDLAAEAEAYGLADFADVNAAFVERLLEWVPAAAPVRALDLGTGPGDIPVRVKRARPRWRILALDASGPMLRLAAEAAQRAGQALQFVTADAKRLPLATDSFEVVFSNSILHHITATELFWREVRRVACPGAAVLLRDLFRPESAEQARALVETYAGDESNLLQEEFYRSLLSSYTPVEIQAQLDAAGLGHLTVETASDRHVDIRGRLALP
jgi:ubiquinone/menaquinone biosynthesis C-methylase UbiE